MNLKDVKKYLVQGLVVSILMSWKPWLQADGCAEMPGPYTADFSMSRNGKTAGSMQVVLESVGDDRFNYSLDTSLNFGLVSIHTHQKSWFTMINDLVIPGNFRSNQKISLYKRSESVDFNWQSMQAVGNKKRKDFELELEPGMQDKLTHYLLLARALCAGTDRFNVDVVSGPVLKPYEYRVLGREILETELGDLQTIHVRRGTADDKKQTDMWHAKETRFMPVKLIYRTEDRIVHMDLTDISFNEF